MTKLVLSHMLGLHEEATQSMVLAESESDRAAAEGEARKYAEAMLGIAGNLSDAERLGAQKSLKLVLQTFEVAAKDIKRDLADRLGREPN